MLDRLRLFKRRHTHRGYSRYVWDVKEGSYWTYTCVECTREFRRPAMIPDNVAEAIARNNGTPEAQKAVEDAIRQAKPPS
jgi:hypothetical protein